jgi:hypothetical protein
MAHKPLKDGKTLWESVIVVYSKFGEEISNGNGGMKAAFILPGHFSLIPFMKISLQVISISCV